MLNDLISLKIPKGWKVEVPLVDYIHYTFKVYNPNNSGWDSCACYAAS